MIDILPAKQYMSAACSQESALVENTCGLPGTEGLSFGSTPAVEDTRSNQSDGPGTPDPLQQLYDRIYQPLVPELPPALSQQESASTKPARRADKFYSELAIQMKKQLHRPTQAYLKSQCLKTGEKLRQDFLTSVVPESSDEGYSYELPEEEENAEEDDYVDPFKQMNSTLDRADLAAIYSRTINHENGLEEQTIKKSLQELRKVIDKNKAISRAEKNSTVQK